MNTYTLAVLISFTATFSYTFDRCPSPEQYSNVPLPVERILEDRKNTLEQNIADYKAGLAELKWYNNEIIAINKKISNVEEELNQASMDNIEIACRKEQVENYFLQFEGERDTRDLLLEEELAFREDYFKAIKSMEKNSNIIKEARIFIGKASKEEKNINCKINKLPNAHTLNLRIQEAEKEIESIDRQLGYGGCILS